MKSTFIQNGYQLNQERIRKNLLISFLMNIFWIPVRNSKQYSWNITRNVSEKSFSNVYSKWPGNLKFN